MRKEKLPVRTKGWRQCVEDCPHQEWPEEPECGEQCCLPHPHEDMRKDHVCKKHCKETFPTLWKMCKEEKERLKRPKVTLTERQFTFTIDEEEEIKRQYQLAKEKEVSRKVQ